MPGTTTYADPNGSAIKPYNVYFRNDKSLELLKRSFDYGEEHFCGEFIRKLKHSKRATLVSYPLLDMR